MPPADLGGRRQSLHELGNGEPAVVGAARLRAVRVDGRGSGKSPGRTDPWSPSRGARFLRRDRMGGRQPWSNGASARYGISYYAMTQWLVASLKPPSLKAMIPWEGAADMYRDFAYHGGIFSFGFVAQLVQQPHGPPPARQAAGRHRSFSRRPGSGTTCATASTASGTRPRARWENIDIPLFTAGNWSGMGLHLRGNTEAYLRARIEAQEAAHPRRHALSPVLLGRRPHRPTALLRPLAQRKRHRHHARAAGEAAHPQGRSRQLPNGGARTNGRSAARAGRSSISIRRRAAAAGCAEGCSSRSRRAGRHRFPIPRAA